MRMHATDPESPKYRAYLYGHEIEACEVDEEEGWAEIIVRSADNKPMYDFENGCIYTTVIYGPVKLVHRDEEQPKVLGGKDNTPIKQPDPKVLK